jgi:hypothetical protein
MAQTTNKYEHDKAGTTFCTYLAGIMVNDQPVIDALTPELHEQLISKVKIMRDSELSALIKMLCRVERHSVTNSKK